MLLHYCTLITLHKLVNTTAMIQHKLMNKVVNYNGYTGNVNYKHKKKNPKKDKNKKQTKTKQRQKQTKNNPTP